MRRAIRYGRAVLFTIPTYRLRKFIRDLSERSKIGLGIFAPYVFGKMIGSKPHKVQ